ncbi:hypothetical protein Achl_4422 (plasmid) [Pseudarthrobacter chlorophenolicus A6]|uniref:Uncharacterized protein n=1 Tax=Pseudarthrobacter chlorophenolicus (strain ATCC 700700 / DSM 12829 / CIP 107037 / JCM 12360 / KCTC 9906 / NCIMB 13794 / A6) TaxID=452863 RepID=B8HIX6_PSECP|nr:hypothetical protein [Pseudarthrobacter chlorophenolicus]ACL42373.1 hypothetical protein Achl_4422 [Pseudarthrobacter chlorophenolicus A6]SDQ17225.1 hypothetical protein SAMN04489738_0479 [Pseudarthrobacter chlorophenolicus]
MATINSLYLLTPMTGRTSGADRTTVIGTVEMKWRTFWIAVIAMVPAGILTAFFFPMLQSWAMLWIPLVEGAAFLLIERRSKDGLRLRTYQAMFDKKRSAVNTFYLCGMPVDVTGETFGTIRQITVPVHRDADDSRPAQPTYFEDFEASSR